MIGPAWGVPSLAFKIAQTLRIDMTTRSTPRPKTPAAPRRKPGVREQSALDTQDNILRAATQIFAKHGYSGGRVDQISKAAKSHDRMIYYYFGSKDGLYLAVLEEAYRRMRTIEADLHLDDMEPIAALRRLVEFTYDHHQGNEDFIRLISSENIHRAHFLRQSKNIRELNSNAIEVVKAIYERGVQQGLLRDGLEPIDIHAAISALTVYNVSNRHTFGVIFNLECNNQKAQILKREQVVSLVLAYCMK